MAFVSAFAAAREILTEDLSMDVEEVVLRARGMGAEQPDSEVRHAISCTRGLLTSVANGTRKLRPPTPARSVQSPRPEPRARPPLSLTEKSDLSAVFDNVARVNTVVGACGGIETAREVAEAVRACGSVDAFLQCLDLVAGIRSADKQQ